MFELNLISVILLITTAINVVVSVIGWKRHDTKTGLYFALGMTSITIWTFAAALGYMAVPLELKVLFAKLDAFGYNFALTLFLIVVMYFSGLDAWIDNKWIKGAILLIPTINVLLISTNELHYWIWKGFRDAGNNITIFERGPGYPWLAITGYAIILVIIAFLGWATQKGSEIQRRQARLLLMATIIPLIANVIYLYEIRGAEGVDWSSVTFSITGILVLRALQSARFTDIIPVARDVLISNSSDGMMVIDNHHRIIDANPAMETILGGSEKFLIGSDLQQILPAIHSHILETMGQKSRMEFEADRTIFDVLISPLYKKENEQEIGHLVVFRNITELKQKELQLQLLNRAVEQSPTSIIITDRNGVITFVNPFFIMLTGYALNEVLGKKPSILKSGQTPDEVYKTMWQSIQSAHMWSGELLNRKKNGELYWVNSIMAPVLDSDGNIQSFFSIQEDITERKIAEQTLENRFLEIQALNKDLQEAQTQIVEQQRQLAILGERQRIGRNLHDSVNQSIHSLMLFSETLIALLENGEIKQAIRAAERIHESGEQALKEVRMLVHEGQAYFMGGYADLIKSVENRIKMVERRVGIQADLSYDLSALERSPAEWMDNIYWIILEGLNNSLKHSQAKRVHVSIVDHTDQITVEIKDDGVGFDPGQEGSGGFGMRSLQERAELLGGVISIESSPGQGTRVKCVLEIPNE